MVTWRFFFRSMLPVGLFMAATLHFGNLVYLHLTVAFIQMLKAFTPVITMAALFATRLETPTRRLILSVLCIALGTALASAGEVALSYTGVAIMLASEVCEAARLVMTQMLLVGLQFHPSACRGGGVGPAGGGEREEDGRAGVAFPSASPRCGEAGSGGQTDDPCFVAVLIVSASPANGPVRRAPHGN